MQPFARPGDDDTCTNDAEGDGPPGHCGSLIDRRGLLRGAAGLIPVTAGMAGLGWAVAPSEAEAASGSPPYPFAKRRVTRMDGNYLWKKGIGADQWVSGEIGGGRILAGWGDGKGWNNSNSRAYMGVTQISGSVGAPVGRDLWRTSSLPMKPCAIIANNGTPLMFAVSDRDGRTGSYLLRGTSGGASFGAPVGPVVSKSRHGLVVVGSFDAAPSKVTAAVGLYLSTDGNLKTAQLYNANRNQAICFAYFNRSDVANLSAWQWYGGRRRIPMFFDKNGSGKHFQVSWCSTTNSYVAVKTHQRQGLGIFSSPNPWGPWSTLWYGNLISDAGAVFSAKAIAMWSTGGTIAVMWSGSPSSNRNINYDAVYLTRFRIQ